LRCLLTEISRYFAPEVSYTTFTGKYNWKLNFENVQDWNHIQFVHPRTLVPLVQFEVNGSPSPALLEKSLLFAKGRPLENFRFFVPPPDQTKHVDVRNASYIGRGALTYVHRWFSVLLKRPCDPGAILAAQIFPNVNFGSIHGEQFYLQEYIPIAPDRTEYHSWIFTARLKDSVSQKPHLLWGMHHAEKRVLDEDILIFEEVQKVLSSASTVGALGDVDAPLSAFARWYMRNVKSCAM
jgi:phenylpropionate dioxygenase-like ring-hydroxylating dioxygenase large terminal subunit